MPSRSFSPQGFHVMAKPSGPACNIDCEYCFYLEKDALFPPKSRSRMSEELLEVYIRNLIAASPPNLPVNFTWQGGEPTLLGVDFYRRAVALQKLHGAGRVIENCLQTNGTLIDENWAAFLADNHFLVGLSIDGPAPLHDRYRRGRDGRPTHALVMRALSLLRAQNCDVNILACVNRETAEHPEAIYRFFKENGIDFIQFIPVVERAGAGHEVTDWSVEPAAWGRFLTTIFDLWRREDVGRVFVMNFEWSLAALMGQPGVICVHQENCGRAIVAEHNGDVFSCDHFVDPAYRLGNLQHDSFADMVDSDAQNFFGRAKSETLPDQCRRCPHLEGCWGGCPKHRFTTSEDGQPGLNYLCAGYVDYLGHIAPHLRLLAALIEAGRDPAEIMAMA